MVTRNDCRQANCHDYVGLSTDDKPTDCGVNSTFYELDTDKKYYFDGDTTWTEIGAGGGK